MDYAIFGFNHLITISIIIMVWVIVLYNGRKFSQWQIKFAAILLALSTISIELFDDVYRYIDGYWSISRDLPLHLCGFSTFLSAYAVYTRNQLSFEFAFYWGIGGALQAIITPDFSGFYNSYYYYIFFISHALIVLNVLWLLVVVKMKVGMYALHRTIIVTLFLMVLVGVFNHLTLSNYFFLCYKPDSTSLFFIGDWPFYILSIIIIGLILVILLDILVKRIQKYIL